MVRNIRCLLLGLAALSLACFLLFTRAGVLVKNVTTVHVHREPVRQALLGGGDRAKHSTLSGSDTSPVLSPPRVNSSDAGSACLCKGDNRAVNSAHTAGLHSSPPSLTPADPKENTVSASNTTVTEPLGSNVVVLTSMRTGSSFVGEIFGRNEDVFYLFEPGLALLTELQYKGALFLQPIYIDMLTSLYRCNVTSYDFYMRWLKRQPPLEVMKKVPRLFDLQCYPSPTEITGLACREMPAELFMRTCREKRNVAIKSIRIWDIGMFLPLIQDSRVKLKVIHLVRDPRGMIASRVLAMNVVENTSNKPRADSFTDEMWSYLMEFCSYSIDNKEVGYYLPKYRDNYLLLRYEDISLDPEGVTQRIYNFTGLGSVPETVTKWIAENTRGYKPGVYSTSRVSSKAYQSWRTKLDYETVKVIQHVGRCAKMMEHFGYLPVQDESHLKNVSSSLLAPIPAPHDSQRYQL